MNRMIVWTAVVLSCLSLCLNIAFANRPTVAWGEMQLSGREVKVSLKNEGSSDWAKFSVTVKVFDGKKLVSTGMLSQARGLKASTESILRFGLNKPVPAGKTYRIQAWVQSGSPHLANHEWTVSIPAGTSMRKFRSDRAFGMLPEVDKLKKPIDVRAEMGLF
ncbi:MAG TPA: hypothetical protein PLP29_07485 [Candidatus Ozemobacteraceae bacterium]|nr:hypothetical protein [Candidatus Ozemobacteraceae bacterium]